MILRRAMALALWAVAGCAASRAPGAMEANEAAIAEMIAHRVEIQRRATGVVIAVVRPEGVRYYSHGVTENGGAAPVDERTVFDVGSLTKAFTASLLASEADAGALSLADVLSDVLPPGVEPPHYEGDEIRLVDLATHTSGLPLRPPNLPSKDPEDPYRGYTEEQMFSAAHGFALERAPGAQFGYSNWGYGLLGAVIASNAGTTYAALLDARILSPLNMRDTALVRTKAMNERAAQGYDGLLDPARRWDFGALAPAGGLSSTASDLAVFIAHMIETTRGVTTGAGETAFSVQRPADFPGTTIALGWRVTKGEETFAWSNGSVGGFRAFMGFNPDRKVGVVALANAATPGGVDDIGMRILDQSMPVDMSAPAARVFVALAPAQLDRVAGTYLGEEYTLEFRRVGTGLVGRVMGQDFDILAEAENRFFAPAFDAEILFDLPAAGGPPMSMRWRQGPIEDAYRRKE